MALLFLCWLPYLVIFYPGTGNEDTVIQMMEYYKIPSYIQTMSPMPDGFTYMTNHHPYLLTLLFGAFFDLGLALGDIRIGIAVTRCCTCSFRRRSLGCLQYLRRVGVRGETRACYYPSADAAAHLSAVRHLYGKGYHLFGFLSDLYPDALRDGQDKGKVLESLKFDLIFG